MSPGFRPTQSTLLAGLLNLFKCLFNRYTIQRANNRGADQTAQMPLLLANPKDRFSRLEAQLYK